MADERKTYRCKRCKRTVVADSGDEDPICCEEPMELELSQCQGVHAEMARNDESEDTCDDGRGQRR